VAGFEPTPLAGFEASGDSVYWHEGKPHRQERVSGPEKPEKNGVKNCFENCLQSRKSGDT
jgi:hypothetical protein